MEKIKKNTQANNIDSLINKTSISLLDGEKLKEIENIPETEKNGKIKEEKKEGFFSKLFGKKSKEEKKEEVIVEILDKKEEVKILEKEIDVKEKEESKKEEVKKEINENILENNLVEEKIPTKLGISKQQKEEIKEPEENKEVQGVKENITNLDDKKVEVEEIENIKNNEKSVFDETKFLHNDEIKEEINENEKIGFFAKIFFRKKSNLEKLNTKNIRSFEQAIKSINFFIDTKDYSKARKGINEIKEKEEIAFNDLLDKVRIEYEQKKQRKIYKTKLDKISKIEDLLNSKEHEYNQKKQEEKFKIKFVGVKQKLDELVGKKQNYEALELLTKFFEENQNSQMVVKFFNKEKQKIQKNIEKQKEKEEKNISKNTRVEALALIGEYTNIGSDNAKNKGEKTKFSGKSFLKSIKEKLSISKVIKRKLQEKQLVDEVTMLLESEAEINEATKLKRLENMHTGLIKELNNEKLLGYEFFAKILGKDKISGDTFSFLETDGFFKFFLGDATGHGIQAGLIITLLTRLFNQFAKNTILEKLVFEINNGLKQDLKSRNFITGLFFEIDKQNLNQIRYVGMGHEPMLIYRYKEKKVEKIMAGGLAAGIRIIPNLEAVKSREIFIDNNDILMIYSDGIVEARNEKNELLGIDGFGKMFEKICLYNTKIPKIYDEIIFELQKFKAGVSKFEDDATIMMLKRNFDNDIQDSKSEYLRDLSLKEGLTKKNVKELEGKTKEEIEKELEKIKRERQTKIIIEKLENLLVTGEILILKQEAVRYIKEGFIHKKINYYLKKAIANEKKYKINLKEQKMLNKYNVLKELMKKGDYQSVIKECNEIIAGDGNI